MTHPSPIPILTTRKPNFVPTHLTFVAAPTSAAQKCFDELVEKYGNASPEQADIIVCIGGDGFMLETLHKYLGLKKAVFGLNLGSVGFLMNPFYTIDHLPTRLAEAQETFLHPLYMHAVTTTGRVEEALALNDVFLFRQTRQAAKIKIAIDNRTRLEELIADGILISTPAGSTAYNLSAQGPIVPLSAELLPLTPISAFRPRRWRGALLPSTADVEFTILEHEKRPVAAVADFTEVRDVISVAVKEDRSLYASILFDHNHSLSERIITEQFTV